MDDLYQCQINCSIIVVSCQKLSNFSQIYANKFLELLLSRAHAWGSKYFGTTLKYSDRESKYFEVVGPHGGPVISEGVQIFQHYSEVIGPGGSKYFEVVGWGGGGGNNFRGVHFFRDRPGEINIIYVRQLVR